jgi:methyl-accepting chemotaxis protein
VLGVVATGALVALSVVAVFVMSGIATEARTAAANQKQAQLLSHAYESWILNDDHNNLYAAVIALRDPSRHKLAATTWAQSVSAYQNTAAQLAELWPMLGDPSERAQLRAIDSSLASYNTSSLQLRNAGLDGEVDKAIYVQSVGNLAASNALPVEFAELHGTLESVASRSASSVEANSSAGIFAVLVITALALPLLLLMVFTTRRSIIVGVRLIHDRLGAIAEEMEERLTTGIRALARGDLTIRLEAKTKPEALRRPDELGRIMRISETVQDSIIECCRAYNLSTEHLRNLLSQVSSTALSVNGTSQRAVEEDAPAVAESGESAAVRMVEERTGKTADGVRVAERARAVFISVGHAVDDLTGRVEQIAAAAQQITASAASMQETIAEVAERPAASTQQVSAERTTVYTQPIAVSTYRLASSATTLNKLIASFQLS